MGAGDRRGRDGDRGRSQQRQGHRGGQFLPDVSGHAADGIVGQETALRLSRMIPWRQSGRSTFATSITIWRNGIRQSSGARKRSQTTSRNERRRSPRWRLPTLGPAMKRSPRRRSPNCARSIPASPCRAWRATASSLTIRPSTLKARASSRACERQGCPKGRPAKLSGPRASSEVACPSSPCSEFGKIGSAA